MSFLALTENGDFVIDDLGHFVLNQWIAIHFPRLSDEDSFRTICDVIIVAYLALTRNFFATYLMMIWSIFFFFQTPWILPIKLYYRIVIKPIYSLNVKILETIGLMALITMVFNRMNRDLDVILSKIFYCAGVIYHYTVEKYGQMAADFKHFWDQLMHALKGVVIILVKAVKGATSYTEDIYSTVLPADVKQRVDKLILFFWSKLRNFYALAKYFFTGFEELIKLVEKTWEDESGPVDRNSNLRISDAHSDKKIGIPEPKPTSSK